VSSWPDRRTCLTDTPGASSRRSTTPTQAAHSDVGRAGELIDALQGWQFPESDIVLDEISLQTPRHVWPPRIRLDYRIGGRRGRWEEEWGDELAWGSVESAADLMMAIVYIHLMDRREPVPEHLKAAS
jgi:hypothetical protein